MHESKIKPAEVEGIRVIPKSEENIFVINYDDIDRYDGKGSNRKGTPKSYEVEQYDEDYGLDISNLKKSDFPLMHNIKTNESKKVKLIEETDDFDVLTYPKIPRGFVMLYFFNDNMSILISKDDVETFKELTTKEQNSVFKTSSKSFK